MPAATIPQKRLRMRSLLNRPRFPASGDFPSQPKDQENVTERLQYESQKQWSAARSGRSNGKCVPEPHFGHPGNLRDAYLLAHGAESDALAISANIQAVHIPYGTILDPIYASPTSDQIVGEGITPARRGDGSR